MSVAKRRSYAKVERSIWRNPTFRNVLSEDGRSMFMHLMTTPRTSKCPGLIEASPMNIMEDLCWDRDGADPAARIVSGLQRTQAALDELSKTVHKSGTPWLVYSAEDRLVLLPRAVVHNLPANSNIVATWLRDLNEYPDLPIIRDWIGAAYHTLQRAFGKEDPRFRVIRTKYYQLAQQSGPNEEPFDAQAADTAEEVPGGDEKKSKPKSPDGLNGSAPISISISNSSNRDTNQSKRLSSQKESTDSEVRRPASSKSKPVYPRQAPKDFSPRQAAFYEALHTSEFYIRAKGTMTAFDAIVDRGGDPVRLARDLGAPDTFPLVDVGLIGRLGAWSHTHKTKAKIDIAKFIINRARYSQERGGSRGAHRGSDETQSTAAAFGDLEAKHKK